MKENNEETSTMSENGMSNDAMRWGINKYWGNFAKDYTVYIANVSQKKIT